MRRPDDDVGEAVAVDVAGGGDRDAAVLILRDAIEPEAIAAIEGRKFDDRWILRHAKSLPD